MKIWVAVTVLAFAIIATTPASAFESWKGPGYYLLEAYYLLSGPYATQADCEAVLAARPAQERDDTNASCEYEATDPDADGN